jgi:enterochelin esterase-like enzyme
MVDAGHLVNFREYDGGHDPDCWAVDLPEALAWLLRDR